MRAPQLHTRFKNPSEYQARLLASLAVLPACQQHNGESDWFPPVDILATFEEYLFTVDLPGLTQEMIQVYVEEDTLSITGERTTTQGTTQRLRIERPCGPFVRHFALPDDASRMEIRATLKDGVLELHVRKILPDDVSVKPCPERFEVRLEPSNSVEPNEGESRPFFRE
jgi:HSP20 family protein